MGDKDYYKILEVHPEASPEIIKKAYQTLTLRYHPDRHIPAKKKWAEEKFKELSEAYSVLSDSIKRRDYDRDGYSEQIAKELNAASTRAEEEAYFYYRMGLEHYKNSQKRASWSILFGKVQSDLRKAQDDFITVLDDYPMSKYVEDAHFYYICTLMENYRYDREFLKETEEEFDEFLDKFPKSKWAAEVKILFAKFYLFKKKDYAKADELLNDIICKYHNTEISQEADLLSQYTERLKKNA